MTSSFSIVVATYNLLPYLKKCLASLLALDFTSYEIIIVNDGSSDGTKEYLDSLNDSRIKVIHHEKNLGTCLARNRGIEAAQGDKLAFIDHDCLADKDWLKNLDLVFATRSADFVFGQVFYVEKNYVGYFPERLVKNISARWPMGCNLAFRKNVLEKIGGFDLDFFHYGNEDTEVALRAISYGLKYERAKEAIVYHQAIDWTTKSLWRSARYASAWPRLKKKYPKLYQHFGPNIKWGKVIDIQDYFYFLFLPILIPILLIRYLAHGKNDLKIFFAKWPIGLFLKRYYIWREAIKNRIFMV